VENVSVRQNNAKVVATCNQRITALNKLVTPNMTISIDGQPMKLTALIAIYQDTIDARAKLIEQRAATKAALTARENADTARVATDEGLDAWVTVQFGARSTQAQEFGFHPHKVTVTSAATKALAAEKSKATREARGTKGKRQKAHIKGTVVVPTEPAAPATTTPAATPAAEVPASTNGASSANGAATPHA
jgi:hypothetical protein